MSVGVCLHVKWLLIQIQETLNNALLVLTFETYTYMLKAAIKKIIKLLYQGSQNLFHHSFCFSSWGFPGSFIINAIHTRLWKTELRGKHRLLKTFLVQAEKTLAVLGGMIVGNTQDCRFKGSSKHGEKIGRAEIKLRYRLEDECRNIRNGIKPKWTNFKKTVFQLTIKL